MPFRLKIKYLAALWLLMIVTTVYSQQKTDSLKQLIANSNNDTTLISSYGLIGDDFYYSGINDSALFYWEKAKEIALEARKKELPEIYKYVINKKLAVLYNDIAYLKINNGDFDGAVNYYNECIYLKQKNNDIEGEIQTYTNLGYLYINKNQIDSALFYNLTAYKLAKLNNLENLVAVSAMQIGVLHTKNGAINQALKRLSESANYFEQAKNTKALAVTYNNIAKAYEELDKNTIALEYFFKSLKIKLNNENKKGAAIVYNNIGACYRNINELELANKYNEKALALFKEMGNNSGEATTLNNIGKVYLLNFKLETAITYFNQSLNIRRSINDIEGIAISQINISKIQYEKGKYRLAIKCLDEANKIMKEIKNTSLTADCSMQLFKNHEKLNNFQKALQYHKEYSKYNQILFSEKNLRKANEIQSKIEIQQRNYQDSIRQVLQIVNNKEIWKSKQKVDNYIIKKGYFFGLFIFVSLILSLLVYYFIKSKS